MADGSEKLLDQLWTVVDASSYTYNICSTAASDSYRDLGRGWQSLVHLYHYLMGLADDRVSEWPLMDSPFPTAFIILAYLGMVNAGPKLMAAKKAFDLKPIILVYNALVAGLNLYIGVELFLMATRLDFSWQCQPVDYSRNPLALRVAAALW